MHFETLTHITFALIIGYILEGLAITGAIYLISKRKLSLSKLTMIFTSITTTIIILDLLSPRISAGARHGYGFGTGFNLIGGDRSSSLESNKVSSTATNLDAYNDMDKYTTI
jgi:hypothetical protein